MGRMCSPKVLMQEYCISRGTVAKYKNLIIRHPEIFGSRKVLEAPRMVRIDEEAFRQALERGAEIERGLRK